MSSQESCVSLEACKVEPEKVEKPSQTQSKSTMLSTPEVRLIPQRHGYKIDKSKYYRNNLMWQVGLLELSNAMDFPANVWNQIPTPFFAAILMGVGGSIAILWSIFAFWDMHRSLRNVQLLRGERQRLKSWRNQCTGNDKCFETRCMIQAWLDVNFRELGWELVDRTLLDLSCGISGILVGTGALMAIRGDIDNVYLASNLLSGYIGNSFLAPYALLTSLWAVFLWVRAGGEQRVLARGKNHLDKDMQGKLRHHSRKHKVYAVVTGVTAIAGTVGSIVSSTMWYGYVVIAPCVISSVFGNLLWRFKIGYSRQLITTKHQLGSLDILQTIQTIQVVKDEVRSGTIDRLACFGESEKLRSNIMSFMVKIGLWDEFCCNLADRALPTKHAFIVNTAYVETFSTEVILAIAKATIITEQRHALAYHERHLIEVYGRYFRALEEAAMPEHENTTK